MIKFKKVLLTIALSIFQLKSEEISLIFPETSDENLHLMKTYKAPFEQFEEIGLFIADKRLHYTISQDLLENKHFDKIIQKDNILNMLETLSKNHWIALNKRDLTIAKNISKEMQDILLGKYGLRKISLPYDISQKIIALKYRCIEQIEMSSNEDLVISDIEKQDELFKQNKEEFCALYQLSHQLTNSPFFHSDISYDFMKSNGITANPRIVIPILEKGHKFSSTIFSEILKKYPNQNYLLETAYLLKKQSYNSYLDYVYHNLFEIKYSKYKSIDRGQTSGSNRNTCMFNSVFFYDFEKHNIPSTKIGSLDKASNYLTHLNKIYSTYGDKFLEEINILKDIQKQTQFLKKNSGSDAIYSFCSEIQNKKIFPGYIFNASVLEIQCHSLLSNFAVFPKNITHSSGDCLFSHYGTGYYGSENVPIIPVSCSLGHAQSLTLI